MQWSDKLRVVRIFALLFLPVAAVYDPEKKIEIARLYGNLHSYAYYFVDLLVGTPPQRVSVILDTGSGLCGFPCKSCTHCGQHVDAPFDFSASSTAKWVVCSSKCDHCSFGRCQYKQSYLEGSSIDGVLFEDTVSMGDVIQYNPPVRAEMGCHQHETKLFYTQKANGILGIQGTSSLLHSFFKDGSHVNSSIFGICLSSEGGRLTVGGSTLDRGEVKWMKSNSRYMVSLHSMDIDGVSIKVSARSSTLLDSGTTFTYFPDTIYIPLSSSIQKHCQTHKTCGQRQGSCYSGLGASPDLSGFPVVKMEFDGLSIDWNPSEYLYYRHDVWCDAFANDGHVASTTLGASFMLNKEVIFDVSTSRVGMAPAACPHYLASDRPPAPKGQSWDEILDEARQKQAQHPQPEDSHRPQSSKAWLTVSIVLLVAISLSAYLVCMVKKYRKAPALPEEGQDLKGYRDMAATVGAATI